MHTMSEARRTFQSSDLSRHSGAVFDAAEDHPVQVTRRDGEALVLMSQREADARESLLQLAAQLIAAATSEHGTLAECMAELFPWMLALTVADQEKCAADLLRTSRASFATNQAHLAIAELTAWRETADAIAAGLGTDLVIEWITDDDVERP
ncbi:prevent-host-death protein [Plantibacter flavus]|uniref:prevent-host-death protein n=1 Tax=Plantibacter flavus TaxID=150123 RepID=UPI003F17EE36